MPVKLALSGNLSEDMTGIWALSTVPDDILSAFKEVRPEPPPTKLPPVTIPVAQIFPLRDIPTPPSKATGSLFPPTWSVNLGSIVEIPTNPVL